MTGSTNILYVMSSDQDNIKVLGQLIDLAKEQHAKLTLLDVIGSLPPSSRMLITSIPTGDLRNMVVENRLEQLESLVSRIGSDGIELQPHVLFGNHSKEIARAAADGRYDLVIKHPEKGNADRNLMRRCHCPVWLLTPSQYDAAGQLIRTRFFEPDMNQGKSPVTFSIPPGSKHREGWFSRAQALFR